MPSHIQGDAVKGNAGAGMSDATAAQPVDSLGGYLGASFVLRRYMQHYPPEVQITIAYLSL